MSQVLWPAPRGATFYITCKKNETKHNKRLYTVKEGGFSLLRTSKGEYFTSKEICL